MELVQQYSALFYGILSVLALLLLLCLIRAVVGPRMADRLIAVNMMGTMVMVSIALLAVIKNQGYLVDICLIYAMISFLAVVVLTRIYTGVYREAKEREKEKGVKEKIRISAFTYYTACPVYCRTFDFLFPAFGFVFTI